MKTTVLLTTEVEVSLKVEFPDPVNPEDVAVLLEKALVSSELFGRPLPIPTCIITVFKENDD